MNGDVLRIGNTTAQLKSRHNLEVLVPDVLFYENQQVASWNVVTLCNVYSNRMFVVFASR